MVTFLFHVVFSANGLKAVCRNVKILQTALRPFAEFRWKNTGILKLLLAAFLQPARDACKKNTLGFFPLQTMPFYSF
jgi:hypothetical protein